MPHTFVIIFLILLGACALTWIIPGGHYARFINEQGVKVIDPAKFKYVGNTPVNPLLLTVYIVKDFAKNINLLLVVLFAGGTFFNPCIWPNLYNSRC